MRFTASTLLLFLFSDALSAQEQMAILDTPPWYQHADGGAQGLLPELTTLLFAEAPPALRPLPPRRLAAEFGSGALQWLYWPCHVPATQLSNLGVVVTTNYGIVVRADSAYHQLSDLRQRTVGVWTERLGMLPELETDPAISKHEVNSLDTALQMLLSRRLDAVSMANGVMNWHVRQGPWPASAFRFVPVREAQMCLFASARVPADRQQQMRARLTDASVQQQIAAIVQRYW